MRAGQTASLPFSFLNFVVMALLVWLLMNCTMLSRNVYAIVGSEEGARGIGANIFQVKVLAGAMAGLAGITHTAASFERPTRSTSWGPSRMLSPPSSSEAHGSRAAMAGSAARSSGSL
jgi:ribose/xylose/arabinose/galactoside ABC-type transport system permease subunit